MDITRLRKSTERCIKADSLRHQKELRITIIEDKRFSMKAENHLNLSLRHTKKLRKPVMKSKIIKW